MEASKQYKKQNKCSVKLEGSSNFTPLVGLTIPVREYFHEDMAFWNVQSQDQLIKNNTPNAKQAPTHPVLVSVSHFECRI